jgi:hypothetical protein
MLDIITFLTKKKQKLKENNYFIAYNFLNILTMINF